MSTNFYLRGQACGTCGRSDDDLHVGLSGAGWVFLWRGWRARDDEDYSPVDRELASPDQWFAFLADQLATGSTLVDEYQQTWTLEKFTEFVRAKREPRHDGPPSRHSDLGSRPDCIHVGGDDVAFHQFS